jgi:hypothetical protein
VLETDDYTQGTCTDVSRIEIHSSLLVENCIVGIYSPLFKYHINDSTIELVVEPLYSDFSLLKVSLTRISNANFALGLFIYEYSSMRILL